MTTLAEPSLDLDLIVLEELDKGLTPKCDGEGCDRDATHTITCPCGKGTEFSCYPCIESMKSAFEGTGSVIWFDPQKSCGHEAMIHACSINPL